MEYSSEKIAPRGEQKKKGEQGLKGSQNKGRQPKTTAARRKMTQSEVLLAAGVLPSSFKNLSLWSLVFMVAKGIKQAV